MNTPRASVPALVLAALVALASTAYAEIAAKGDFTADFDGSLPTFTFSGNATFDDFDGDVGGTMTNFFDTFPGGALLTNGEVGLGGFDVDFTASNSATGAFLSLTDVVGTPEFCQTAGCPAGTVTFVGFPTSITFSPGLLPGIPRIYTIDGTVPFNFSGGDEVDGEFALNAFPVFDAPTGSPTVASGFQFFWDTVKEAGAFFDASIAFDDVTVSGNVFFIGFSAASGSLPPGYLLNVGGLFSVFVDISTTAEYEGPIEVCLGVNTGQVQPSLPTDLIRLLHRPDSASSAFVDTNATYSDNPPTLCATVDSLSPFVLAVTETPPSTTSTTIVTTTSTSTITTTWVPDGVSHDWIVDGEWDSSRVRGGPRLRDGRGPRLFQSRVLGGDGLSAQHTRMDLPTWTKTPDRFPHRTDFEG